MTGSGNRRIVRTPLTDEVIEGLHSGDRVVITGTMLAARDSAHKRLVGLIEAGMRLPVDLRGGIIYYVGPTPARPGMPIGSAGPTTSGRMDVYTPVLLEHGLKGMVGKGRRSEMTKAALVTHRAVYFAAVGGAGALLAHHIVSSEIVAYEDLGPEAIRRLEIVDFPVVVVNDIYGRDLYEEGRKAYRRSGL